MLKNILGHIMWKNKITARELSERTGISATTISKIRNNDRAVIDTDTIERLCRGLGITHEELLAWESEESQTPVEV